MILAGDIGGTKTVLALFEVAGDELHERRKSKFASGGFATFDALVCEFLDAAERPALRAACVGVAGAVIGGRSKLTNLPWILEERGLAASLSVPRVKLLNDLEAAAYGMLHLPGSGYAVLNPASEPGRKGNVAVIAAGTGLGEAILYWDGTNYHPIASEGGHTDFAPRNDLEIDLLRYLRGHLRGHVSYERVLSGPGVFNLYRFLRQRGEIAEPEWLARELAASKDAGATIARGAFERDDPLCVATLDLFAALYGSEAGNLALKCLAAGGVFVGGGIAPKLLPVLRRGPFMQGFTDKGRFGDFLRGLEVRVALDPEAPLIGAARYALRI